MQNGIKLRPHHVARFARYYLEGNLLGTKYGEEFARGVYALFNKIAKRVVSQVTLINGLDDVCQLCIQTTKRKKPFCDRREELQQDPGALLAMAKSQLVAGQTYSVDDFLRRVKRIGKSYPQEELLELIQSAYPNMQG